AVREGAGPVRVLGRADERRQGPRRQLDHALRRALQVGSASRIASVRPMDDDDLARRSILGFGEMVAALGGERAIRRPDAVGARLDGAVDNHWLDAAVVPLDAEPPADAPDLPHSLWTVAPAAPG